MGRRTRPADRRHVRGRLAADRPAIFPDDVRRPERAARRADRRVRPHPAAIAGLLQQARSGRRDESHHQRRRHHSAGDRLSAHRRRPGRVDDRVDCLQHADGQRRPGGGGAGRHADHVRGDVMALEPCAGRFPSGAQPCRRRERQPPGEPVRGARSPSLHARRPEHRDVLGIERGVARCEHPRGGVYQRAAA